VSSYWEITRRVPVEGVLCGTSLSVDARRVYGDWPVAFNCSVLIFGTEINFHLKRIFRYVTVL
jgi:hypothetical protein